MISDRAPLQHTEVSAAAGPHHTELTSKRLTRDGALLHTEVSAATGPLYVSLSLSLFLYLSFSLSFSFALAGGGTDLHFLRP